MAVFEAAVTVPLNVYVATLNVTLRVSELLLPAVSIAVTVILFEPGSKSIWASLVVRCASPDGDRSLARGIGVGLSGLTNGKRRGSIIVVVMAAAAGIAAHPHVYNQHQGQYRPEAYRPSVFRCYQTKIIHKTTCFFSRVSAYSSIGCLTATDRPAWDKRSMICIMQAGHPVATASAPDSTMRDNFLFPIFRDRS